jgi:hypothetical protein
MVNVLSIQQYFPVTGTQQQVRLPTAKRAVYSLSGGSKYVQKATISFNAFCLTNIDGVFASSNQNGHIWLGWDSGILTKNETNLESTATSISNSAVVIPQLTTITIPIQSVVTAFYLLGYNINLVTTPAGTNRLYIPISIVME